MDADLEFCVEDAGCNKSLLAFSHRGARRFALYEFLQAFPVNRLFLRDARSGWYNGQVGELGLNPREVAASLAASLARLSATWSGATGSSMGGYAAILYGCLLGVDSVLAFSPQTILESIYPDSPDPALPCSMPDLAPIVARAPRTKIYVVCGEDDVVDMFYAARIASLPNVTVLTIVGADHLIIKWLYDRGELGGVFREWIAGGTAPILQSASALADPAILRGLQVAVEAHHRGQQAIAVEALSPIVAQRPGWVGAKCMLGRSLLKSGNPALAETFLRSAVDLDPTLPEAPRYLARALMAQDKLEQALHFFQLAVELLPEWAEAYYDIGECHYKSGDENASRRAFLRALELKPDWPMPRERMTELGFELFAG